MKQKTKIDWQGVSWVIFHGISWRRDVKDLLVHLYRKNFPRLHALQDKRQFHRDIAQVDKSAPGVKERLVEATIKTEYGRKLIAKHMVGGK